MFILWRLGREGFTSDYDDGGEVADNIAVNFRLNELEPLPHVPHSWGEPLPPAMCRPFELIVASDILLYVASYPNCCLALPLPFAALTIDLLLANGCNIFFPNNSFSSRQSFCFNGEAAGLGWVGGEMGAGWYILPQRGKNHAVQMGLDGPFFPFPAFGGGGLKGGIHTFFSRYSPTRKHKIDPLKMRISEHKKYNSADF